MTGDEQRLLRRQLLLGAGAATLGAACGPADEFDSEESIDTVQQPAPNYTGVPSWSWQTINNFFTQVRDIRWLRENGYTFPRRISWLYPDGGCEARAEIICNRAQISFLTRPYKIYVMGVLRFTTPYAAPGWTNVTWPWHIAPIVKNSSSGNPFVLDPSIRPAGPLTPQNWVNHFGGDINNAVVVPSTFWGPGGGSGNITDRAYDEMEGTYLRLERMRLEALGLNPTQLLGDNPPWL